MLRSRCVVVVTSTSLIPADVVSEPCDGAADDEVIEALCVKTISDLKFAMFHGARAVFDTEGHPLHTELHKVLQQVISAELDAEQEATKENLFNRWKELSKDGKHRAQVLIFIHASCSRYNYLLVEHPCTVTSSHCTAGPGDTICIIGIAEALRLKVYVFVPPMDGVAVSANTFHRPCVINGSKLLRSPPSVYVTIANGHFTALTKPASNSTAVTNRASYSLLDLMKPDLCPATAKCAEHNCLLLRS
jgi:hypothetical protein